jgi:hypothetical protein
MHKVMIVYDKTTVIFSELLLNHNLTLDKNMDLFPSLINEKQTKMMWECIKTVTAQVNQLVAK